MLVLVLAVHRPAAYVGLGHLEFRVKPAHEPMLNVPPAVVATLAALALVHVVRVYLLSDAQDLAFLRLFAFIPARYDRSLIIGDEYPGGLAAEIWTFVSYAFIHADLMHIGFNVAWLLPFGSAVARRFGTTRFLVFMAVTAAAGAGVHLATHLGERVPVVGASAAISGAMAAAIRFAFQRGGPLGLWGQSDPDAYRVPAAPLLAALRDPRILAFLAVWFGFNLLFGIGSLPLLGNGQQVAWEAHIGGFLAGLVLFSAFDPADARPRLGGSGERDTEPTYH
jgi:membrane associated rhomboid family serine protease